MDTNLCYDTIQENFTLNGTESRLVDAILQYVESHCYSDQERDEALLELLNPIGFEQQDIDSLYKNGGLEKTEDDD